MMMPQARPLKTVSLWIILLVSTFHGCKVPHRREPPPSATARRPLAPITLATHAAAHPFALELACSADELARGLMGRHALAPGDGMLFVFADEAPRTFWMHNTPLSLDLLFFDRAGKLTCIIDRAQPMTDTPRSCPLPSAYVVELLAGTAARLNLTSDTRILNIEGKRLCAAATARTP